MIKSFTVTNYLGDILEMELTNPEETGFIIKSVTGLGPDKTTVNIKEIASNDGGYFAGSRTPVKNIVINLLFIGTPLIEDTRHKSYKYFPVKKPLKLGVITDRYDLEISGYVESNTPDIFSKEEGCQISILCPIPYFSAKKKQIVQTLGNNPMFEFPFSNELIKNPELPEESSINLLNMSRVALAEEPTHDSNTTIDLLYTWPSSEISDVFYPLFPWYYDGLTSQPRGNSPIPWPYSLITRTLKKGEYYIFEFTISMKAYSNASIDGFDSRMCKFGGLRYYSNSAYKNIPLLNYDGTTANPKDYISRDTDIFPPTTGNYEEISVTNKKFMIKVTQEILDTVGQFPGSFVSDALGGSIHLMEFVAEYYNGTYDSSTNSFTWTVNTSPEKPSNFMEGDFGMQDSFLEGGYRNEVSHLMCWLVSPISTDEPGDDEPTIPSSEYLIDETLPDEWLEVDGFRYNYRISKGIIFGNLNNYQFEHVVDYEGTKDVGFVMTIEFENGLAPTEWDGKMESAGYIVIKDTKYIAESIIINLDKIKELLPKATAYTVVGDMEYEVDPGELNVIPPIAQKGDILTIDTRSGSKSAYYQKTELWSYTVERGGSGSTGGGIDSPPSEIPLIPNQKVKWQPSYEYDQTEYIKRQFNVLGAVNREATWFSLSQGINTLIIRHTFHPDLEELQYSDRDLVRASFLSVQTENDIYFEGI